MKDSAVGNGTGAVCGAPREGRPPCGSSVALCGECGRCVNHCEHRETTIRRARQKGGRTSIAKRARRGFQDVYLPEEDALPRPQTIQDCARWLSTIAWAVSVGRLAPDRADKARAATRDLKDLLLKDQDKRIDELEKVIKRLKAGAKEGR